MLIKDKFVKNSQDKIKIKMGLGHFVLIFIAFGIGIYLITEFLLSVLERREFSIYVALIQGISSITINLIVIAFVSLLIEITSIKKYIQYVVKQVAVEIENLVTDKYAWNYTHLSTDDLTEHLNLLFLEIVKRQREEKNIYFPINLENIKNSSLSLLPKILNDITYGKYYEDYDINVRIKMIDNNNIEFIVTIGYMVRNDRDKVFHYCSMYPSLASSKSLYFDNIFIMSEDKKHTYCNIAEKVNNKLKPLKTRDKQNHHNIYKIEFDEPLHNLTYDDYYFEYTKRYIKHIKNGVFVHSLPKTVRNFKAEIMIDGDGNNRYKLYSLSFFPYKQAVDQFDFKFKEISHGPHNIQIQNGNWCLPGSGFSVTIMENLDCICE